MKHVRGCLIFAVCLGGSCVGLVQVFGTSIPERAEEGTVEGPHHVGTYEAGRIQWSIRLARSGAWFEPTRFEFVDPLPESARMVEGSHGGMNLERNEEGEVVAASLEGLPQPHGEVAFTRRWRPGSGEPLEPPLLERDAFQRISLRGVRYDPGRASKFERYLGYVAPGGLERDPTEGFVEPGAGIEQVEQVLYVQDDGFPDAGLVGAYETVEARRRRGMQVLGGLALLLVCLGLGAYGWLGRRLDNQSSAPLTTDGPVDGPSWARS